MPSSSDAPTEEDALFRDSQSYPEIFPIIFTHGEFPTSASVMQSVGVPFGCLTTPFMPLADRSNFVSKLRKNADNASKIARCTVCMGYMNPYCDVSPQRWFCSLCGQRNGISRSQTRYRGVDPRLLPEVQHVLIDYKTAETSSQSKPFVHVLLVQESMPLDSLTAVVDSLSTAITSVHPDVYILLITFSNRIGVYRLSGAQSSATPKSQSNVPELSRQESNESEARKGQLHTPTPPPVQHIHFTYPKSAEAMNSPFDLAGVKQSILGSKGCEIIAGSSVAAGRFDNSALDDILGLRGGRDTAADIRYGDVADRIEANRSIIEGRDPAVDFIDISNGEKRSTTKSAETIEPLLRIGEAINFWDACSRVGSCRCEYDTN